MKHIRPYQLFAAFDAPPSSRVVQSTLPVRRAMGGITLLETFLLTAASRIVAAQRVFEFGTFHGSTTFNLALNIPDDGVVFTLDLDAWDAERAVQHPADAPLTGIHLSSKAALDFLGSTVESKIKTLSGNSLQFDFTPWSNSIDLTFIDGGHDLVTVESDSCNAFQMSRRDKLSCVLWHDYGNRDYPELSAFLDRLSRTEPMVHVEDTMLCAWFHDPERRLKLPDA